MSTICQHCGRAISFAHIRRSCPHCYRDFRTAATKPLIEPDLPNFEGSGGDTSSADTSEAIEPSTPTLLSDSSNSNFGSTSAGGGTD